MAKKTTTTKSGDASQPVLDDKANEAGTDTSLASPEDPSTEDPSTQTEAESSRFEDWKLAPSLMRALTDMGYDRPMPVQEAVFKTLSDGGDLMVQSKTGSGKTAAFGIPIAQRLSGCKKGVQSLILAPTRELALQVAKEITKLVQHMDLTVVPIYGGAPIGPQIQKLDDGGQIVAGTPGRVLDHIRRGTMKTSGISMLVLDECDEMLSMGFQEEIENIVSTLPAKEDRQTLLFSATIPKEIERIGRRHMRNPEMLSLSSDSIGAELIDHYYYVVSGMARNRDLLKLLKAEKPDSAIIFCNTREETNGVSRYLRKNGYDAEALSSDLSQSDRERVMGRMRDKNLSFLVATDIAARGIDISELSHVINYTFPSSPEIYVHRSGRTGRAGKEGTALSLVGPREIGAFYYLKLIYKIIPTERELPTSDEMAAIEEGELYQRVVAMFEGDARKEHVALARRLWQSNEGERVVALLLANLLSKKTSDSTKSTPRSPAKTLDAVAASVRAPETRAVDSANDERPRRKRRRRERPEQEEITGKADTKVVVDELPSSAAETESQSAKTGEDVNSKSAETTESAESAEETMSNVTQTRTRRRRRRGRSSEEETASEQEGTAPVEASEEAVKASEEEGTAPVEATEEAVTTSEEEGGKEVAETACAEAQTPEETEEDPVVPEKKRRRRGSASRTAGAIKVAEKSEDTLEVTEESAEAPKATPETKSQATTKTRTRTSQVSKSSKRRERKPRSEAGNHAEFWEAWADNKQEVPPSDDNASSSKDSDSKVSTSDEGPAQDPKPTKKRRRSRRGGSRNRQEEQIFDEEEATANSTETTATDSSSKDAPADLSVRLFVNVGKREEADIDSIRDFLGEALGAEADKLGRITLRNTHCYVRVPEEFADQVIETCTGLVFRERDVVVERARAKR